MSFAPSKDRWQLGIVRMHTVEGEEELFFIYVGINYFLNSCSMAKLAYLDTIYIFLATEW